MGLVWREWLTEMRWKMGCAGKEHGKDHGAVHAWKAVSRTGALALAGFLFALFSDLSPPDAQEMQFFRIGTGATGGTYYPIGSLVARAISNPPGSRPCEEGGSCGVPGVIAAAQATAGSVANIEAVAKGELESGLAQSDIIYAAYHGSGIYGDSGGYPEIRVIADFYPEDVHLVVRRGAGIKGVEDLKGKRVSIDTEGSGTRVNALLIMEAFGVGGGDIQAVQVNPDKAVDMLLDDALDAFFFIAGYPVGAIEDLARIERIDLVPIAGPKAEVLRRLNPFFSAHEIPAGTYEGLGAVETLGLSTQWVVSANMDEELVYRITRALWHPGNRKNLDSGHEKGRLITLDTALKGVATPLHRGAVRYYREIGLLKH